jgi:hypothetical protein
MLSDVYHRQASAVLALEAQSITLTMLLVSFSPLLQLLPAWLG